ncbi:nSTAND1 domain-containing NTPase [Nocardioides astragali]|uniref:BTAD domain-containing putative transcriptional regulator n=1 Tax=Nocardioides astragali TaxID=1776736 RepID=A0ABW2N7X2_9ACTN|nr:BTAD domain-containing putative transcriptional regulator [Nocardioides astragali]
MGIHVLGPLTVDGSGRLGTHDRVVLQALATRLGAPVSADELMDVLWGDTPPASAAKNVQSCIVRLRKILGPGAIETSPHGYVLMVPPDRVDAYDFEARVARARGLLTVGESDRVVYQLEQALALWRGPAFPDLPEWPPARREAERLDELRLEAQEMHVDAMLRSGRPREVLAQAQALVSAAPLREHRWELLVLAQYQTGAQAEALRSMRQLRTVLVRELGIDPAPEVLALEQSILERDPGLLVPQPRVGAGQCPWQGLKAYDVDDTERFFGRDPDIQACLDLLTWGSFAALVGPSGSGKSSIMRAGVLAALRERGHRIVLITPGRRPLEALSALRENADARTVLAVDQTEEVFALCEDLEEQRDFLGRLAHEATRRPVILTLRGDRLSQVTEHPGLSRLVERGLHLVGSLDEEALRAAVTGPAQQAGLILEPGLVDLLVREVRDDPGALPLMSHALLETWRRREGSTLTVEGYHSTGGIQGAVAQSAEQLYGSIGADERHVLRDLVLRLVSPGIDGEAVRTRVPRRLIASDAHHERLIGMLVDARLVTSHEEVLEITHEALANAWPRLRGWLDDDVEGQRIRHHLSGAADAWDTLERPDSELYRGVRLARALEWQSGTRSTLTDTEREFLDAAREASDAEERSAEEHARDQARLIRRLRMVLGGAVALLALALAAGGLAAVQSDRANDNAARARQLAVHADARRVGVRSQLTDDISLSLLLAVAGARLDDSPETRVNLVTALAKRPTLVRSEPPGGGYLEGFDVSHDGRFIASSDDQNRMHLYDASTNRLLRSYDAGRPTEAGQAYMYPAFSPDGRQLAVVLEQARSLEPVRLLDSETMQPTRQLDFPGGKPLWGNDVQFSANGRYLAATLSTGPVEEALEKRGYALVWDLRSPSTPPVRVPTGTGLQGLALSPDGRTLYTNWPLTAYDVASGERLWRREALTAWITLDVNRAGTLLALEDYTRGHGLLVDAATGETVHTLRGHRDQVFDIQFSPDGTVVGSVSQDGELIVWDTATGRPVERWNTFDPWGVGFSPDNDLVYGGGGDSMLRTWDLSGRDTYLQQTTQVGDSELFAQADISPDGRQVAYRWLDDRGEGWVRFVDTRTGEATPATRLPVNESQFVLGTWHPRGGQYAAYCEAQQCAKTIVSVLDSVTGKELRRSRDMVDRDASVWTLAYVDDGRSLLVTDSVRRTLTVDAETLRPRGELFNIPGDVIAPIGDGSTAMLYEAAGDGLSARWRVIDVNSGAVQSEGDLGLAPYTSVASPDGSTVAAAGSSGEIVTVDVSTGDQRRSTGLGAAVRWLNYSDDGRRLVSGAADGGVSLWDATTLDLLGTVHPPDRGTPVPAGAQFIGDTHDVAIASYDGRIYQWETDVDRAMDFACQMAGRTLTEDEWEQVLPAQPYQSVCPDE